MTTMVVVLAFAKYREDLEPNPVNSLLAKRAEEVIDFLQTETDDDVMVVAQWETARQLTKDNYTVDEVVTPKSGHLRANGRRYLDTEDVVNVAEHIKKREGITDIIVVANPFIHLGAAQRMFAKRKFTVLDYKIKPVGFDPSPLNLQWWCKGPIRFLTYLGIQVMGKLIRRDFHGIGEKDPNSKTP